MVVAMEDDMITKKRRTEIMKELKAIAKSNGVKNIYQCPFDKGEKCKNLVCAWKNKAAYQMDDGTESHSCGLWVGSGDFICYRPKGEFEVTFAHEVGHVVIEMWKEKNDKHYYDFSQSIWEDYMDERNAWAWALRYLKDRVGIEEYGNIYKHYRECLKTYELGLIDDYTDPDIDEYEKTDEMIRKCNRISRRMKIEEKVLRS